MNDNKDKVFSQEIEKKFEFDKTVASVFDDMLERSVPFYSEVRSLIIDLILANENDNKRLLDLGSSTAAFLLELYSRKQTQMQLIGIDNSEAMTDRAIQKAKAFGAEIELILGDVMEYDLSGIDFVISNYTLQFIRPMQRIELINRIYDGLNDDGLFIFSEKVTFADKRLDKEMIDIYHRYKQARGYSKYEISQKREALENVLVPFTIQENIDMCRKAGFTDVQTIFQWANFVTFVARK